MYLVHTEVISMEIGKIDFFPVIAGANTVLIFLPLILLVFLGSSS